MNREKKPSAATMCIDIIRILEYNTHEENYPEDVQIPKDQSTCR